MAGESLTARFSLLSQLWFRWTEKCLETATSHMQTVSHKLKIELQTKFQIHLKIYLYKLKSKY